MREAFVRTPIAAFRKINSHLSVRVISYMSFYVLKEEIEFRNIKNDKRFAVITPRTPNE